MRLLLMFVMLAQMAGVWQSSPQTVQRLPLQKKEIVLESPKNYAQRLVRIDPATGKEVYYDPKPEVVLLDAKTGKHGLRWIGYDGKQKTIIYYRPDAFEAIIRASVIRRSSGEYLYTYTIENATSSAQKVEGFALQTFAADVRPLKIPDVYTGEMSKNAVMKEGNWAHFGFPSAGQAVAPGRRLELKLLSSAPPGLVECRMHGILGMKGVGEEPPLELENVLPGYEAWPSGYTIGPVDQLKSFSVTKRAKYLRNRLAQFQQLGWIAAELVPWYEQNLQANRLGQVFKRAMEDFKAGKLTSELLAMMQSASQ
ncbi:MAG: hypothetical protein V7641_1295 [Blastocatellia bacterium]